MPEPDATEDPIAEALRPKVSPERRKLLYAVTLGSGVLIGSALAVPVLGFLVWPVRRRDDAQWKPVGRAEDFADGRTVKVRYEDPQALGWAGIAGAGAAWLRREGDKFVVLGSYCTHTGCPVSWLEGASLFFCPCHAGAFNRDGAVVSGPPPAPLQRLDVRVRDGVVELRGTGVPLDVPAEARGGTPCPLAKGRRGA